MFAFFKDFEILSDDKITLRLSEKLHGNDVMLPFYYYDIYENGMDKCIGKISIRIGNNDHSYYNGHIGYEINEEHRGKHYSYYATMLVVLVAKAHEMKYIYITCRESNIASRKIIEKTNASLQEIAKIPNDCFFWRQNIEDYCIYRLNL